VVISKFYKGHYLNNDRNNELFQSTSLSIIRVELMIKRRDLGAFMEKHVASLSNLPTSCELKYGIAFSL
jgi:hypothetical protein